MRSATPSATATTGMSEDPLSEDLGDPIVNQPRPTVGNDDMFQQDVEDHSGGEGHQQLGGSATGAANPGGGVTFLGTTVTASELEGYLNHRTVEGIKGHSRHDRLVAAQGSTQGV